MAWVNQYWRVVATINGNIEALEEWNNLLRTAVEQMWFDLYQKLIIISGTQKIFKGGMHISRFDFGYEKRVTKSAIFQKVGVFIQCVCAWLLVYPDLKVL